MTEAATVDEGRCVVLTADARDVGRVLENACYFASKDQSRPVLCCVHLTVEQGDGSAWLVVEATDTYALGEDRCRVEDDGSAVEDAPEHGVLLPVAEVKDAAKALNRQQGDVRVEVSEGGVRFTVGANIIGVPALDGYAGHAEQYPSTSHLWTDTTEETGRITTRPEILSKLAKVKGADGKKAQHVRFEFVGEGKPFRVTVLGHGETFRALVMPVRES